MKLGGGSEMNDEILKIDSLYVQYKTDESTVKALNGISLSLQRGETLGLVGETGAGKTTTALSIMGILPEGTGKIIEGSINFKDNELTTIRKSEMLKIRGHKISMIFQDPQTSLNPSKTVGAQIAEVIKLHSKMSKKDINRKVEEMLQLVGIPKERANAYPHQFSGGMKQRVVIAMALTCNPELLIADEPTTALDVTIQAQVLKMMGDLKAKYNTAMILITHDLGVVAEICDKVAIMYAGEIIESGSAEDIFDRAAHPYTIGLLGSIPDLDTKVKRLKPIPGLMPDPTALPSGCRFHPRCPKATETCSTMSPGIAGNNSHKVKCILFVNEDGKGDN